MRTGLRKQKVGDYKVFIFFLANSKLRFSSLCEQSLCCLVVFIAVFYHHHYLYQYRYLYRYLLWLCCIVVFIVMFCYHRYLYMYRYLRRCNRHCYLHLCRIRYGHSYHFACCKYSAVSLWRENLVRAEAASYEPV